MTRIAQAHGYASADFAAFFAKWADMATWPEWNSDTEWVRLDGPFREGATGALKPKGGPAVRFTVTRVTDDEFVDVSRLLGARLTFAHRLTREGERTRLDVEVSLTGPLGPLWRLILGKGLAASAQPDTDRLIAAIEQVAA
jgi:hypothetical protein